MSGFLFAHSVKDFRGGCEILPQTFGVLGVNALVFLFERNSQGQNLTFGKAVEIAHASIISGGNLKHAGGAGTSRFPPPVAVTRPREQRGAGRRGAPAGPEGRRTSQ